MLGHFYNNGEIEGRLSKLIMENNIETQIQDTKQVVATTRLISFST